MKKTIMLLCWLLPALCYAQTNEKISFVKAKNWQEILTLARTENKLIFVDAYATWCGPCKMMDNDVFTNKQVADFVNANFIAVKIQMDSTAQDDQYVKNWFPDVANFKQYVTGYPSFLFYNSGGEYSGKEEGFYKPEEFVAVLKKVIDPKGSYIAQVKAYRQGSLTPVQILKLAFWARDSKDDSTALEIAGFYKSRYFDNRTVTSLLNPEDDRFISNFLELFSFKDMIIRYMYDHPEITDVKFARWPGYSKIITDQLISRDNIYSIILPKDVPIKGEPDWKKLNSKIAKAFDGKIAKRLILDAQIYWTYLKKDWKQNVALEFKKADTYGMDTTGMGRLRINNLAYDIVFKSIEDKALITKAIFYMEIVLDLDSRENATSHSHLDTYACILYKAGQKSEAIEIELKALELANKQKSEGPVAEYTDKIAKMEKDLPIWKMY